jgi:hypothetical protein
MIRAISQRRLDIVELFLRYGSNLPIEVILARLDSDSPVVTFDEGLRLLTYSLRYSGLNTDLENIVEKLCASNFNSYARYRVMEVVCGFPHTPPGPPSAELLARLERNLLSKQHTDPHAALTADLQAGAEMDFRSYRGRRPSMLDIEDKWMHDPSAFVKIKQQSMLARLMARAKEYLGMDKNGKTKLVVQQKELSAQQVLVRPPSATTTVSTVVSDVLENENVGAKALTVRERISAEYRVRLTWILDDLTLNKVDFKWLERMFTFAPDKMDKLKERRALRCKRELLRQRINERRLKVAAARGAPPPLLEPELPPSEPDDDDEGMTEEQILKRSEDEAKLVGAMRSDPLRLTEYKEYMVKKRFLKNRNLLWSIPLMSLEEAIAINPFIKLVRERRSRLALFIIFLLLSITSFHLSTLDSLAAGHQQQHRVRPGGTRRCQKRLARPSRTQCVSGARAGPCPSAYSG